MLFFAVYCDSFTHSVLHMQYSVSATCITCKEVSCASSCEPFCKPERKGRTIYPLHWSSCWPDAFCAQSISALSALTRSRCVHGCGCCITCRPFFLLCPSAVSSCQGLMHFWLEASTANSVSTALPDIECRTAKSDAGGCLLLSMRPMLCCGTYSNVIHLAGNATIQGN